MNKKVKFKFKKGDKVVINSKISAYYFKDNHNMYEGKELIVKGVSIGNGYLGLSSGKQYTGKMYLLSDNRWHAEFWLDSLNNQEDLRNILKDGQLIELESGHTFIKFGKMLVQVSNSKFIPIDDIDKELKRCDRAAIKSIYESNDAKHIASVHGEGSIAYDIFERETLRNDLKKVWEREE